MDRRVGGYEGGGKCGWWEIVAGGAVIGRFSEVCVAVVGISLADAIATRQVYRDGAGYGCAWEYPADGSGHAPWHLCDYTCATDRGRGSQDERGEFDRQL